MIKQELMAAKAPWKAKKVRSDRVPFSVSGVTPNIINLSKLPIKPFMKSLPFVPNDSV